MAWAEKWQNVNWRFFAYFNIFPIIIFYTITMTGCLPGTQSIYLVKFKVPNSNSTSSSEIRVGYFGICSGDPSNFICLSSHGATASALTLKFRQYSAQVPYDIDVEPLIQFAMTLQGRVFPPLLAASGVIFFLGLVSFALLKLDIRKGRRLAPYRTEQYRKWAISFFWAATGLALASTVAVAQTAAGIQFTTTETAQFANTLNGTEKSPRLLDNDDSAALVSTVYPFDRTIKAGIAQQILQWFTVACLFIFSVGVSAMHNQSFVKIDGDPYLGAQKSVGQPLLPQPSGLPPSAPSLPPPPPPPLPPPPLLPPPP